MSGDRRRAPALARWFAAAVLACGAAAGAAEPTTPLPVLGVDPIAQGTIVEHHADAVSHWVGRRIGGAVLLHIGASDGLGAVAPEHLATLQALRDRDDTDALLQAGRAGRAKGLHEGNFVRAAAGLGIVREVVWVTPFTFLGEEAAAENLKSFMTREGFSAADVASFRPVDGCYRGTVAGLPVTVCGQERLPPIDAPVIVSLDVSFVTNAAGHRGITILTEIRALFAALRAAGYRASDAVVAQATEPGHLPPALRWVGEAVVEILRNPELALRDEPPERWNVLQQLWELRVQGAAAEGQMLNVALSVLQSHPHDPSLLLFAALASAGHGGGEAALKYAEQACNVEPGYCAGLREIGVELMWRGNFEMGGRMFAAEERLQPRLQFAQFQKGIALLWAGRPADALKAFEAVGAREGAFPSAFMIGAIQAAAGDRAAARRAFDQGFAVVEQASSLGVVAPEVSHAVEKAVAFYREEGLTRQAQLLSDDPRLRYRPPEAAP